MKKNPTFVYNISNSGCPQVLLIGNGLERGCKPSIPGPKGVTEQLSWEELVAAISVKGCAELSAEENEKIPFPLKYSLLSVPASSPSRMDKTMIDEEEHRLQSAMNKLSQHSTWRLDALKTLGADHIMTTNYSYGLEQSFFPGKDFFKPNTRKNHRFNLNPRIKNNKPVREVNYRMHTGYLANNQDGSHVGLWHIHGECSVPRGVVLGHDRYGRLLSRIEKLCDSQNYFAISKKSKTFPLNHGWSYFYTEIFI